MSNCYTHCLTYYIPCDEFGNNIVTGEGKR